MSSDVPLRPDPDGASEGVPPATLRGPSTPGPDPAPASGPDPAPASRADAAPTSGADLARAALASAREAARARGVRPRPAGSRPVAGSRRGGYSGSGPDERDPQPLGVALGGLLAARGWQETSKVAAVMGDWERIVGADVAAHCRPESLQDGVLTVVAESTAWATQLRLLQRRVLQAVAEGVGAGVVSSLRIHGPTTPSWSRGPASGGRSRSSRHLRLTRRRKTSQSPLAALTPRSGPGTRGQARSRLCGRVSASTFPCRPRGQVHFAHVHAPGGTPSLRPHRRKKSPWPASSRIRPPPRPPRRPSPPPSSRRLRRRRATRRAASPSWRAWRRSASGPACTSARPVSAGSTTSSTKWWTTPSTRRSPVTATGWRSRSWRTVGSACATTDAGSRSTCTRWRSARRWRSSSRPCTPAASSTESPTQSPAACTGWACPWSTRCPAGSRWRSGGTAISGPSRTPRRVRRLR